MPSWMGTVATLAAGSLLAILSGWVSNRWVITREREARSEARRDQLLLRRDEFQRETLLRLQEAAAGLIRATASLHYHDLLRLKQGRPWNTVRYPDEIAEAQRAALMDMSMLSVRVRDELTRDFASEARERAVAVLDNQTAEEGGEAMQAATQMIEVLNVRIGQVLHGLDKAVDRRLARPKRQRWPWQRLPMIDPVTVMREDTEDA